MLSLGSCGLSLCCYLLAAFEESGGLVSAGNMRREEYKPHIVANEIACKLICAPQEWARDFQQG